MAENKIIAIDPKQNAPDHLTPELREEVIYREGKIEIIGNSKVVTKLATRSFIFRCGKPIVYCICAGILYCMYGAKAIKLVEGFILSYNSS